MIKATAKTLIIFGAPGSGKGTICSKLINDFKFNHISTGNLLRTHIANNTDLGNQVKSYMQKGILVPDKLVIDVLMNELKSAGESTSNLLDGFPRTVDQAKILTMSQKIDAVLCLDVPIDVIVQRLSGRWTHLKSGRTYAYDYNPPKNLGFDDITGEPLEQRLDDKPETIRKRLDEYNQVTSPLIDFFKQQKQIQFANFTGTESNVIYSRLKPFIIENHYVSIMLYYLS